MHPPPPRPSRLTPKNLIVFFASLLVVGAGAAGVYLADRHFYAPMREQKRMVDNLKAIVELLTRDERIAQVVVIEQGGEPLRTKFRFVEVDARGEPCCDPIVFDIEGKVAYFDTLVIKFEEPYLPLNDQALKQEEMGRLTGKSVIFFRRIFGEKQKPEDGLPIDSFGQAPGAYRGKTPPTEVEQQLWKEFWDLANDADLAKKRGVRAAHGEAVYTELKKDTLYVLERRFGGDLTIRPDRIPAALRK